MSVLIAAVLIYGLIAVLILKEPGSANSESSGNPSGAGAGSLK
jgi:hypothetical protein